MYPEGHPRHCSLCRKRAVEEALKRITEEHSETLSALAKSEAEEREAGK